ncbi:FliM/FliN family flagellar motor switch protein [Clostridioides difficile]|uniref:FliM/FliN family flagellar motor switch protein n=1 Tax=Clostridioides difficile TaxID=1496 RepID=UPI001C1B9AF1|nr:FliM/FliN family flagellar motor switch protein [Clostridioides difficile]MBY1703615.1 FliM/FliN family flagellar motor switch protein [Clostridioides difficile]MBY1918877.1 FliM/FliN family flagellar motor switch protein [Clostridioides difficile]MBY2538788.1 FliM/FliN family flagellar motor switch protein [Clostridioides difficile]MCH7278315.1 FliM/FliN family flagellar motor switch protein [Clostridioides difficile]
MNDMKEYDFGKPQSYSRENLTCLNFLLAEFCKKYKNYIIYELKCNSSMVVDSIDQVNYQTFLDRVTSSCVVVQNAMEPVMKNFSFRIDRSVADMWIDITSGGTGVVKDNDRELTELDKKVLLHLMDDLVRNMHLFEGFENIQVLDTHTHINLPQLCSPTAPVCVVDLKVLNDNEYIGSVSLCFPYNGLEALLESIYVIEFFDNDIGDDSEEFTKKIYNSVSNIELSVIAEIGKVSINVEDLLKLEVGDVIVTNKKINDYIDIFVENSKSYTATPGFISSKKGVKINDAVGKEV